MSDLLTLSDTQLRDHEAIRQLLARYCLNLDVDDIDAWIQLFTPDAEYHVYGRVFAAHEGILRIPSGAPKGLHLGGVSDVTMTGDDTATVRSNLLFVEAGTDIMRSVVYDDDLVRTDGGWKFAIRRCRFIRTHGLDDRPER